MIRLETRKKIGEILPIIFWRILGTIVFPLGMVIAIFHLGFMSMMLFGWITGQDEHMHREDFLWSFKTMLIYGIPSTSMALFIGLY